MSAGYLRVQVRTGAGAIPLEGADVVVSYPNGKIILRTKTDLNGSTEAFLIGAPDLRRTLDPNCPGPLYTAVNVVVRKEGFVTCHVSNVQIFDGVTTILPVDLEPLSAENGATDKYIDIPPPGLACGSAPPASLLRKP